MNRRRWFLFTLIFVLINFGCTGQAHRQKIRLIHAGDRFPETTLPVPSDPGSRKYLGTLRENNFTLKELKADLIVVEILSVYCPSCQRQIKAYDKLYDLIKKDPQTKGRIKLIGIGAGNSQAEVSNFRDRYKVRFPIIPDPQYHLYNAIGETRAPFTIYVRLDPKIPAAIVAKTHFGMNLQYKNVFEELKETMEINMASKASRASIKEAHPPVVKPILTKAELEAKLNMLFNEFGNLIGRLKKVALKSKRTVYTALIDQNGVPQRLFAEVVSRPPVCIDCHDIHFIYMFNPSGRVVEFEPIQLTKYGNEPWNQNDLDKIRSRIIGKTLSASIIFRSEVDAISSATITSSVIFNSLSQGESLIEELKIKGLI